MSSPSHLPPDPGDGTDSLIADILASLATITHHFAASEHEGWQWITQHSSDPLVAELLHDMTTTAARVLNAIGSLEPVNGITISEQAHIPKGTVSKITRQLLAKHLIDAESRPLNKKEIFFRLTPLGRELVQVHRAFDGLMERGFRRFLHRYTTEELHLVVRLLRDATDTSFVTLGQASSPDSGHDQ